MINIFPESKDIMIKDAISSFPDECCGFFYGREDANGNRNITDVLVVHNSKEGDKQKRFEISAKDYLKAEQFAEEQQLQFLGVYHSHPDHPAIPSEHDRISAQPFFSYVIISVSESEIKDIRSWRLNDSFQFEEERVGSSEWQEGNPLATNH